MIYVITHKNFDDDFIDKKNYRILHVGNSLNCKEEYLRDDIGDNISDKNAHFCELTGQYWIWKNINEDQNEITGLVHYRRFFTTDKEDILYTYFNLKPAPLKYNLICNELESNDIILPKPTKIFRTVKSYYSDLHDLNDLKITREVVDKIRPECLDSFDKVMSMHYFYYGNMFLCKRKLFDSYSEWLFPILFELERNIDINKNGDKYQARVIGFIAERLLQVWVNYKQLSVKEFPVYNVDEKRITVFQKNYNRVKRLLRRAGDK